MHYICFLFVYVLFFKVEFLGHLVSKDSMSVQNSKINAMRD